MYLLFLIVNQKIMDTIICKAVNTYYLFIFKLKLFFLVIRLLNGRAHFKPVNYIILTPPPPYAVKHVWTLNIFYFIYYYILLYII